MNPPSLLFTNPITKAQDMVVDLDLAKAAGDLLQEIAAAPVTPIADSAQLERAKTFVRRLSHMARALDESRIKVKGPFKETGDAIDRGAKLLTTPIETLVQTIKREELDYANRVERARREQEETRLRAEEEARRANEIEMRPTPAIVVPTAPQIRPADVPTREDKVLKVLDPAKIPLTYWTLNESKLKADIASGAFNDPSAAIVVIERKVVVR